MTLKDLIPEITALSPADKFQLIQIVLQQLAVEQGFQTSQSIPFDPHQFFDTTQQATVLKKSLRGTLKHYANPSLIDREQTAWLNSVGDNYESG